MLKSSKLFPMVLLGNEKRAPGCLGYIRDYCPVLWGLSETMMRIPISRPGFHGK